MKNVISASLTLALTLPLMPAIQAAAPEQTCVKPTPVTQTATVVRKKRKPPVKASAPVLLSLYEQALKALQQGRVSEAQMLLQQQLARDPEHESARKLQTTLYLDAGKKQEAAILLREGLSRNPASLDMAMTLARIEAERGQLDGARKTLQKSAPYASRHAPYLAFMAAVEQKSGRHAEAESLLSQALTIQPGTAQWLFARGVLRQTLAKKSGAHADLEAALASGLLDSRQQQQARQRLRQLQ